ncbi:MAG: isochorismatase family protein [Planctomycetes bacterium]|nr:isochorismatase family protein [Planctomycetota bacterium]
MSYPMVTIATWQEAIRPASRPAPGVDARRAALLVIDCQEHFAGIGAPILDTIAAAVEGARARGAFVLFTQHGHADPPSDAGMLAEWWDEHIIEGSADHRLIAGISVGPRDVVIAKRRYDAFFRTDLDAMLRERQVRDLALCGVMTNLCVETTARSAFVRDFRVHVLMDACAAASEPMHLASLVNLAYGFAHVQTTAEWLSRLG